MPPARIIIPNRLVKARSRGVRVFLIAFAPAEEPYKNPSAGPHNTAKHYGSETRSRRRRTTFSSGSDGRGLRGRCERDRQRRQYAEA